MRGGQFAAISIWLWACFGGHAMKPLFETVDRLQGAMDFHRERQSVLAGNLANLDTPGYKPFDLERIEGTTAGALAIVQTQAGHLPAPEGMSATTRAYKDPGGSVGADGNNVDLERELAKVDANKVRYATSTELASRRLALLRYAATDGTG